MGTFPPPLGKGNRHKTAFVLPGVIGTFFFANLQILGFFLCFLNYMLQGLD